MLTSKRGHCLGFAVILKSVYSIKMFRCL